MTVTWVRFIDRVLEIVQPNSPRDELCTICERSELGTLLSSGQRVSKHFKVEVKERKSISLSLDHES